MQPTFFIPHGGGPAFFMDWNPADAWDKMKGFLAGIIPSLPERPKAIIVVTAHWESPEVTVSTNPSPELYYDYYGFPKHTYEFTWKPKNDLAVANRALELLWSAGIGAQEDSERGYDHGVFIPMMVAVPDADIPIVPISLRRDLDPEHHIAIGRALKPLRDEGILILGSGFSYHNIGAMMGRSEAVHAEEFDEWLNAAVTSDPAKRDAEIAKWASAPGGRESHPREEHLAPIWVVSGAASGEPAAQVYSDTVMGAKNSGFKFG